MPRMTGSRLFAEMLKGYGITHVFFVPTILMDALAHGNAPVSHYLGVVTRKSMTLIAPN